MPELFLQSFGFLGSVIMRLHHFPLMIALDTAAIVLEDCSNLRRCALDCEADAHRLWAGRRGGHGCWRRRLLYSSRAV
ncbi:hypothetical protein Y032_0020g55 [Ancylostoma ceylanicum]|uniref:Uncharacterized protein n=1 Tax=Ancylostoma ceylanicum TaxID=53326 RepID=A0A016V0L0_9BILA|nr:hypothetical protein Y032_0020g55 [Ancylostoma ceylanicum]